MKSGTNSTEVKPALSSPSIFSIAQYRKDLLLARQRTLEGSQQLNIPHGLIEYSTIGEGAPVLYIHGAGGGHDMGQLCVRQIGGKFFWICPSRFGYLRTPIPKVATFESQADAYAALLDHLGVEKAAVIGLSQGGSSAILFALRHPDRCSALVLQSAVSKTFAKRPISDRFFNSLFRIDFLFWIFSRIGKNKLIKEFGSDPAEINGPGPADRKFVDEVLSIFHPTSQRYPGIANDQKATLSNKQYDLDKIHQPTLILHALDDGLVPYEFATYAHERIPNSELITFQTGGHIFIALDQRFKEVITRFLTEHTSIK